MKWGQGQGGQRRVMCAVYCYGGAEDKQLGKWV